MTNYIGNIVAALSWRLGMLVSIPSTTLAKEFHAGSIEDCYLFAKLAVGKDTKVFAGILARLVQNLIRYGVVLDTTLKEPVFVKTLEESFKVEENAKWLNFLYSTTDSIPNSSWPTKLTKEFEIRNNLVPGCYSKYYQKEEGGQDNVLCQET